jgi:PKD repeat protein
MKKIFLTLLTPFLLNAAWSQCSLREVGLPQRTASSDLIVEGKVISKNSFWNASNTMIYTANTVEVYKVFKGSLSGSTLEVLTVGGIVGNRMIKADPNLHLVIGDVGVFTLENVKRFNVPSSHKSAVPQYEAYASVQGFIKYDLVNMTASDPFRTYTDIEAQVYNVVLPANLTWQTIIPFDIHTTGNANKGQGPQVMAPAITNFSPTTVTAGTGTVLTINGTGFGATQGSGTVGFKNADDGGSTYINPLPTEYLSWSDTQIQVEVPSDAGTGTIRVTQGTTTTSSQTLTVSYAHLNVNFDPGTGTEAYQTDHINDNGSGGYTWRMNTGFDADASAKASFLRAFDTWRCATGVNWTIGTTTSVNDAISDGTNVICFDNTAPLSSGILGVCFSYWSGCASGPNIIWYVNELDIIFDEGSNISPLTWEYGPSLPSGSEYDFETVAVHELGHGHQLGHVIAPGAIMHFSISNGTSNRSLGVDDEAGGDFVQAKSIVANVCGPGAMTNFSCGTPPVAAFTGTPTTLCAGGTVSFTDQSTNTPTSWAWTFTGGTPSSSTAQNPTITYNTPGTYAVSLTATNSSGSDNETISGYITVNANPSSSGSITHLSCNGAGDGAINLTPSGGQAPYTFLWNPSGQTSEDRSSLSAGSYTVTVTDDNGCTNQNSFTVTQPAVLTASMSKTDATCANNDGTATATPSGGTSPYSYLWAPGGQTAQTATGLASGTYTCTVTDDNGCVANNSITVNLACGTTQLTATYCGATLTALNQQMFCIAVSGANNYQYRINGPGVAPNFVYTRNSSFTNFYMSWVTGVQYNATYTVEVRARIGTTWGSYGPVCNVTTPATTPLTQLAPSSCNITLSALNQQLFCNAVSGASNYRYRINGANVTNFVYTRGSNLTNFYMSWITGVRYAEIYSVEVASYVGGVWSAYGTACNVTTPAFPTTQITNYCNMTTPAVSTQLTHDAISGASNYRWRVTNLTTMVTTTLTRGSATASWNLNAFSGTVNTSYDIEIAALVGGVWGPYGTICTVTTGPVPVAPEDEFRTPGANGNNEQSITLFPNPAADKVVITTGNGMRSVTVLDALGTRISTQTASGETEMQISLGHLAAGIYFIQAETDAGITTRKVIKE